MSILLFRYLATLPDNRRYGGCELHAVASILGGCAAQEAIKLVTKQYVPVDNLFVFNAVKSETVSLKV